jgi:hypothetical protein
MGLADRKAISDDAVPCPAVSPAIAGMLPGRPMEATVAATEPLRKFRRVKASFVWWSFKVLLLLWNSGMRD